MECLQGGGHRRGKESAGIILGKVFRLQMEGENWSAHFKDVRGARRAFKRLEISADQVEDVLWNSIFVMSVASSGNTVLRTEIDNVILTSLATNGRPYRKMDEDVDCKRNYDEATSAWNGPSEHRQQPDATREAGTQEHKVYKLR